MPVLTFIRIQMLIRIKYLNHKIKLSLLMLINDLNNLIKFKLYNFEFDNLIKFYVYS
jgi:hypothetical protein